MEQLDEDANVLVLAAGRRTSAWPRVRSRGLAQDTLRLGDLRLECAVAVAIARAGLAWMSRAALDRAAGADVWGLEGVTWWLSEGAAVRRAVIRQPGQRAELAVRASRLAVPVAERAWSNDALISIERA
ncbi:MAG TPA: hypothetical protein VFF16_18475, partial [Telluria sp.]|nr:hypothetical protein [Telluria sp.]